MLAALTLGLACLFFGFNAGANNNDEHNKRAEQSEQEDARAKTKTADNYVIHLNSYESDSDAGTIMPVKLIYLLMMQEAAISAASIMRRSDQRELKREYTGFGKFKVEKKAQGWENKQSSAHHPGGPKTKGTRHGHSHKSNNKKKK